MMEIANDGTAQPSDRQHDERFTVWVFNEQDHLSWVDSLEERGTGSSGTVLRCLGELGMPSRMQTGLELCLFRHDVVPMWEHVKHRTAGRLTLCVAREHADDAWIRTVMLYFNRKEMAKVSGIHLRKSSFGTRISLWLGSLDATLDKEGLKQNVAPIAELWKKVIAVPGGALSFQATFRTWKTQRMAVW